MTAPDDGLDAWLAELSGRPAGAATAMPQPGRAEAALLRRLMTAQRAQRERAVQAPSAASEAAHWQRVRAQLALGADALPVEPARPRSWAANQPLWAWAAGLTAMAVLLPWALHSPPSGDVGAPGDGTAGVVMRGGAAPQVLQAPSAGHAAALADRVEQALGQHQQRYRRQPLGDAGWQIQAKVAPESAAAAALAREGVLVPAGGLVDLQVVVKATPSAVSAASAAMR